MCLTKIRKWFRGLQERYEEIISKDNLFGFNKIYFKAIDKIEEKEKGKKEGEKEDATV